MAWRAIKASKHTGRIKGESWDRLHRIVLPYVNGCYRLAADQSFRLQGAVGQARLKEARSPPTPDSNTLWWIIDNSTDQITKDQDTFLRPLPFWKPIPSLPARGYVKLCNCITFESIKSCCSGVSRPACTLLLIWRRGTLILFPSLAVILVHLVADQGKASQHSKLKIIIKLCYAERVPSRFVKEMAIQLLPTAIPIRLLSPSLKLIWVISWHLDGPTWESQCFLAWFELRKMPPKSEIVSYPCTAGTHLWWL